MTLLDIAMTLLSVGIGLWFMHNYVPITGSVKRSIIAVVIVAVGIWLLQVSGSWPSTAMTASAGTTK